MEHEPSLSLPGQLLDVLDFPTFLLDAAGKVTHASRAARLKRQDPVDRRGRPGHPQGV